MENEFLPFVVLRAPLPSQDKPSSLNAITVQNVEIPRTDERTGGSSRTSNSSLNRNSNSYPTSNKTYQIVKGLIEKDISSFYPEKLPINLMGFINWFDTYNTSTDDFFLFKLKENFGLELDDLVRSQIFMESKREINRNLIYFSIYNKSYGGLASKILRAFKFISAIEDLTSFGTLGIAKQFKKLIERPVLLPKDIFPINIEDEVSKVYWEGIEQEENDRQAEIDKLIVKKNKELDSLKDALVELESVFNEQLEEFSDDREEDNGGYLTTKPASFSQKIPFSRLQTIPEEVKKTLTQENLPMSKGLDFYAAFTKLDSKIKAVNEDLISLKNPSIDFGLLEQLRPKIGECSLGTVQSIPPVAPITLMKESKLKPSIYVGDLMKVRQKTVRYELGEIAHIENVLKGETKLSKYRLMSKLEETSILESELKQEVEQAYETDNQFELQNESSLTQQQESSKEAGITINSLGAVKYTVTGNYASSKASEISKETSQKYAREIIEKSSKKIIERVLKQKKTVTTEEREKVFEHSFQNNLPESEHINGIYMWVNKIYEVQVINYGKRIFLEYLIPNPASLYRKILEVSSNKSGNFKKPQKPGFCVKGKFYPLEPKHLDDSLWPYISTGTWVSLYNLKDVTPPPPKYKQVSFNKVVKVENNEGNPRLIEENEASISIPKGYSLKSASYTVTYGIVNSKSTPKEDFLYASILIGNNPVKISNNKKPEEFFINEFKNTVISTEGGGRYYIPYLNWTELVREGIENQDFRGYFEGLLDISKLKYLKSDEMETSLPLSIAGFSTLAFTINLNVSILCERIHESMEQWKMDFYSKIMDAYEEMDVKFMQEQESLKYSTFSSIQGKNPMSNREVERIELKRQFLSFLTGHDFKGLEAITEKSLIQMGNGSDIVDNQSLVLQTIRTLENALEWHNMTYVFYDYFWSNESQWDKMHQIEDLDPLFEKFLKAGMARVQVPITSGFENKLFNMIQLGQIGAWADDQEAPLLVDEVSTVPFLSMLDEIKKEMGTDIDLGVGRIRVEDKSDRVKGINMEFVENDLIDREIIINRKRYQIVNVQEPEQIFYIHPVFEKTEENEQMENLKYFLGGKFVGNSWETIIPTQLLFLKK